jgi:hypothetical protein
MPEAEYEVAVIAWRKRRHLWMLGKGEPWEPGVPRADQQAEEPDKPAGEQDDTAPRG